MVGFYKNCHPRDESCYVRVLPVLADHLMLDLSDKQITCDIPGFGSRPHREFPNRELD